MVVASITYTALEYFKRMQHCTVSDNWNWQMNSTVIRHPGCDILPVYLLLFLALLQENICK